MCDNVEKSSAEEFHLSISRIPEKWRKTGGHKWQVHDSPVLPELPQTGYAASCRDVWQAESHLEVRGHFSLRTGVSPSLHNGLI